MGSKLRSWAWAATATINFEPDRQAVRGELLCHLEDSMEAKLALGMTAEAAEARVLAEMGSPAPVAEQMGVLYRPFWGRVWQRTRWLKNLALVYLALVVAVNLFSGVSYRLGYDPDAYIDNLYVEAFAADLRPEGRLEIGDYTVSVHRLVLIDREGTPDAAGRSAWFTLRIGHGNPWLQMPYFAYNMHTVDNVGGLYPIRDNQGPPSRETCGNMAYSGPFVTYMEMWITQIDPAATQLELRFDSLGPAEGLRVDIPAWEG